MFNWRKKFKLCYSESIILHIHKWLFNPNHSGYLLIFMGWTNNYNFYKRTYIWKLALYVLIFLKSKGKYPLISFLQLSNDPLQFSQWVRSGLTEIEVYKEEIYIWDRWLNQIKYAFNINKLKKVCICLLPTWLVSFFLLKF